MAQVQACSWNTFRLSEIVTIEKCLQEILAQDPRMSLLLRKLSTECFFVEPERKIRHLNRTKEEELADEELKRQSSLLIGRIEQIDKELENYRKRMELLERKKEEQVNELKDLENQIESVEKLCKTLSPVLELLLERTYDSFRNSFTIITNDLLDYMQSTAGSSLIKQLYSLPTIYRQSLTKLIRRIHPNAKRTNCCYGNNGPATNRTVSDLDSSQINNGGGCQSATVTGGGDVGVVSPQIKSLLDGASGGGGSNLSAELATMFKKLSINRFKSYLKDLEELYKDSMLIEGLYSDEIPRELQHYKALEEYLAKLREPLGEAPQRITYLQRAPVQDGHSAAGSSSLFPVGTDSQQQQQRGLGLPAGSGWSSSESSGLGVGTSSAASHLHGSGRDKSELEEELFLPDRSEDKQLMRDINQLLLL